MQNILDENLDPIVNDNTSNVEYASFWTRVGGSIIDALVFVVIFPLTFFNITEWKSIPVLILISIISTAYKPVLEFYKGATLGKMAVGIKVVDYQYEKASLTHILMRNIFHICFAAINLFFSVLLFSRPEFMDIDGFFEFSKYSSTHTGPISNIIGLFTIIDSIMLFADKQKRTLHDKIGKTYVIKNSQKVPPVVV